MVDEREFRDSFIDWEMVGFGEECDEVAEEDIVFESSKQVRKQLHSKVCCFLKWFNVTHCVERLI